MLGASCHYEVGIDGLRGEEVRGEEGASVIISTSTPRGELYFGLFGHCWETNQIP